MTINSKLDKGFTLVELLASIIVLIAIGSIISGIISSSLRGANKTNTIENIRQSGNYVLNQMSKDIMYAQVFNGLSETGADGTYVASCFYDPPPPVKFIKITPLDRNPITYKCDSTELSVDGVPLIDTSISLTNCSFTCTQANATDVPIIGISFALGPKNSNGLVENSNPPITFKTSVTIRNYRK
ncbi:MAG: hypothetical protein A3B47_02725 [Candidatus Levybacteria bacterium RIFCSPLOWO2_01_FULL_39_24]|nr:MAG: hypothetical protein A2800_02015 [Candidatus Levybacteria bacterium RIFCSPHIGHO2_01_FULL_40_16]OGH28825.1 MAG: hypothetical protein A3E12_04005 [Candidatus Levybacteria bacterium RIFCSPHIGHO2_12_FULL_39_9]OGH46535.1 MAG: hypothetical protein A3B47_02725 [Candidatus Levybacteria bacterium RIFCSPLOWO2_01_FULL_39_24]